MRGQAQRLIARRGSPMLQRCADLSGLDCVAVASNPLAAGLAIRGSRVAHAHEARSVYSGLLGRRLFGVPYVLTRRVVSPQKPSWIRDRAYRQASAVAAVSSAVAEQVKARYPGIEVPVVHDACAEFKSDPEQVARIRGRYPGKTLLGNVAALDDSAKGQSAIIDAARLARDRHPDWQFLLCGDGRDEQRFREQIGDLSNIELVGWVDNVGDYLASFDLFLFPSRHEALGSTLLDALQAGLPVIASNVGGIPDIVQDGINGRLIAPGSPDEILAAAEALLQSGEALQALGLRNRQRATEFSARHMADAYMQLYEIANQVAI